MFGHFRSFQSQCSIVTTFGSIVNDKYQQSEDEWEMNFPKGFSLNKYLKSVSTSTAKK